MSSFTQFDGQLDTRYDREASIKLGIDHWRVLTGFHYYLDPDDTRTAVHVPRGFLTDGASVPRMFWNLLPPWGSYGQAAVVHDMLCEYLSWTYDGLPHSITRQEADQTLRAMMKVLGVPVWKQETMYAAVRAYAIVCRVNKPSSTALKRELEAQWVIDNPELIYGMTKT